MPKLLNFLEKIRVFFVLENDVKKKIINLGFGEPIKVLERKSNKYYVCPKNSPPEYCTTVSFLDETVYLTDCNKKVKVTEIYNDGYSFEFNEEI